MSNTTIHGGPAFPMASVTVLAEDMSHTSLTHPGMTLRDYFAAKAMQALIAYADNDYVMDKFAELAYMQADAMLKSRALDPGVPAKHERAVEAIRAPL